MRLPSIYQQCTVIILLFLTIFLSCSKSPTNDEMANDDPLVLSVTPVHAAPGVLLSVSGFTVDTSKMTNYTIYIGGQQSLVISDNNGVVSSIAPMFFADSTDTWPTPPISALSIEIYLDSSLVAVGTNIFSVDSLPHAPGATLEFVNNSITTVESYKSILASLVTVPGLFEQMVVGITVGFDSLMYGSNDSTLTDQLTALQSSTPDAVELIDALYRSSGIVGNSQQMADALQAIADNLNQPLLKSSSVAANDVALATMMQLSTIVRDFGDSYISGVAQSSSNASSIAGGVGLIFNLNPALLAIKAFVSVLAIETSVVNLIFNKVIVATLPTKLDSMTVTLASDTISTNDTTSSILMVYASNNPPQITFADLVDQFLAFAGILVPGAETSREKILDAINYVVGQIKNGLASYHASHPEFVYNPAFFDFVGMPVIQWEAEVNDVRLLDLHTSVPGKLNVNDSTLEWYAMGRSGSSNITITPATGAEASLLPIPPFFEYHGTAFGILDSSSVFSSVAKTVIIRSALALEVDFATIISKTGSNVLGVRAGTINLIGDTTWTSGLNVTLTPIGGTADLISGTTDSNGQFSSIIKLSSGSDSVIVDIRVTSSLGNFAATEVKAIVANTNLTPRFTVFHINETTFSRHILGISEDGLTVDTIISSSLLDAPYIWSPDGTKLEANSNIISVDGSVVALAETSIASGCFSPDGKFLYGTHLKTISSFPTDGSAKEILYSEVIPEIGNFHYQPPSISSDGKFLVFYMVAITHPTDQSVINTHKIILLEIATKATTVLKSFTSSGNRNLIKGLSWSPNNNSIVFAASINNGSTDQLYLTTQKIILLNITTKQETILFQKDITHTDLANYTNVSFFPDNNILIVKWLNNANNSEITKFNPSSLSTLWTKEIKGGGFIISKDGNLIGVVEQAQSGNNKLLIYNSDGILVGTSPTINGASSVRWKP